MRIEYGLNPNCSEAVFRFYTLEPNRMRDILQALADEINETTNWAAHKGQKIPAFGNAQEYETPLGEVTEADVKAMREETGEAYRRLHLGEITEKRHHELLLEAGDRFQRKKYPAGVLLRACAGMEDEECVITVERQKGAFRLNIGNNDILEDKTGWVKKVMDMGIQVQEAERTKELQRYARDCTCGVRFFPEDYAGLLTDDSPVTLRKGECRET
jgi:hypothetical protein